MIDAVLGKFYKYIILALLIIILGYFFYTNSLAGDLLKAEANKAKAVANAVQPYITAAKKAADDKATLERKWAEKIIEVERNAAIQIQAINVDARNAQSAADSLSK